MLGMIVAMAIGASACSTGGGFKGIRMGILFKALAQDVRRMISPESAWVVQKWHHITTRVLDDATVRTALLVVFSYIAIYAVGALVGVYFGYDLVESLFESVSVGANVGLSCGVTSPTMPAAMKAIYIVGMWCGRLEFMSLFALVAYAAAWLRGR
jgi:trk system potassium uptake protein TrkH